MQSLDAASFKADVNDVLCMLCFTDDGTVQWSSVLGQVQTGFVQRIVHVFRASCSISEAFAKGFGENPPDDNSSEHGKQSEGASDDPILLNCEKDMIILGKRVLDSSSLWFALVGRPFTLEYGRHCVEMLHTLEQLAHVLFPGQDGGSLDNLHKLCDSICELLRSKSFLFWSDKGRITHFMDSLVTFCKAQTAECTENIPLEERHHQPWTAVLQSLDSFQQVVSHRSNGPIPRLLVFSSDSKPLFARNFSPRETQMLMWYYSTCVTSRFRGFESFFSEQKDRNVLSVWHRRRGLVLFAIFFLEKAPAESTLRELQRSADALVDAVLVANS